MFSEKIKGEKNPNHKSNTTDLERKSRSPFSKEFIKYKDKKQFMGKMKELYLKQLETGSLGEKQDEDYLYEQYLTQEKLNEEYWEYISKTDNDPGYTPTPEEEEQNFQQRIKDENI